MAKIVIVGRVCSKCGNPMIGEYCTKRFVEAVAKVTDEKLKQVKEVGK